MLQHHMLISVLNNFQTLKNNVTILFHKFVKYKSHQVLVGLFLFFSIPLLLQCHHSPKTYRCTTHWTRCFTFHVPRFRTLFTTSMSTREFTTCLTFVTHRTLHGPYRSMYFSFSIRRSSFSAMRARYSNI